MPAFVNLEEIRPVVDEMFSNDSAINRLFSPRGDGVQRRLGEERLFVMHVIL